MITEKQLEELFSSKRPEGDEALLRAFQDKVDDIKALIGWKLDLIPTGYQFEAYQEEYPQSTIPSSSSYGIEINSLGYGQLNILFKDCHEHVLYIFEYGYSGLRWIRTIRL